MYFFDSFTIKYKPITYVMYSIIPYNLGGGYKKANMVYK
jgi:hypothetical protein